MTGEPSLSRMFASMVQSTCAIGSGALRGLSGTEGSARQIFHTGLGLSSGLVQLAEKLTPPCQSMDVVLIELQNKMRAFEYFEFPDLILDIRPDAALPLDEAIQKARSLGRYPSIWLTEGLSHCFAAHHWEHWDRGGLLVARHFPQWSLTPLHAGMSLAFAERLLAPLRDENQFDAFRQAMRRFNFLCRINSTDQYQGVAFEGLGLVVRNLYPGLAMVVEQCLEEIDGTLVPYFWHGFGRGIYFSPINFLPWNNSPWRCVELAKEEPPHETGRRNAMAGVAFALTLVNATHPEVLAAFMQCHGQELSGDESFASGVAAASSVWNESANESATALGPQHSADRFQYQPAGQRGAS